MDLFGLGGAQIQSGSGEGSDSDSDVPDLPHAGPGPNATVSVSSEDDDSADSEDSLDSAQQRALAAEARLKDLNTEVTGVKPKVTPLPSVTDFFNEVDGPPSFLDPEATRPVAVSYTHGRTPAPMSSVTPSGSQPKAFDIARMAPALKGQKREGEDTSGAVIEAKAKRNKTDHGPTYTDLQVAMMGGNLRDKASKAGPSAGPSVPGPTLPHIDDGSGKKPSKAMDVAEFLNKGEGAALMPRKAQDRKVKEQAKRVKGQSSVHGWKTEAEMVLRQQFDS